MRIDAKAADLVPIPAPPLICGLVVARDESFAVAQPQDHTIRFYGRAGNLLRRLGRSGDAAGGVRSDNANWLADTLWVFDFQRHRISLITPGPAFARTLSLPAGARDLGGISRVSPLAVYSDQSILATTFAEPPSLLIVRVELGTGRMRTVAMLESIPGTHQINTAAHRRLDLDLLPAIFVFGVSPHGEFTAVARLKGQESEPGAGAEPTPDTRGHALVSIALLDADGDTLFDRQINIIGTRIPRSTVDSLIDLRAARLSPGDANVFRKNVYVPPFWPPVKSLVVADDGTSWMQIHDSELTSRYLVGVTSSGPSICR